MPFQTLRPRARVKEAEQIGWIGFAPPERREAERGERSALIHSGAFSVPAPHPLRVPPSVADQTGRADATEKQTRRDARKPGGICLAARFRRAPVLEERLELAIPGACRA